MPSKASYSIPRCQKENGLPMSTWDLSHVLLKYALGILKSDLLAQVVALIDVVTGFLCKDHPANSVWSCWETLSLSLTLMSCSSAMFCWARWPRKDISTSAKQQVWRVMQMS